MLTMINRSIAGSAAFAAALVAISAAAPVRAETETVRVPVSYSDVDLSTKDGVDTMHRRIGNAAVKVCGGANAVNRFHAAACRKDVVSAAREQLGMVQARQASTVQLASAR